MNRMMKAFTLLMLVLQLVRANSTIRTMNGRQTDLQETGDVSRSKSEGALQEKLIKRRVLIGNSQRQLDDSDEELPANPPQFVRQNAEYDVREVLEFPASIPVRRMDGHRQIPLAEILNIPVSIPMRRNNAQSHISLDDLDRHLSRQADQGDNHHVERKLPGLQFLRELFRRGAGARAARVGDYVEELNGVELNEENQEKFEQFLGISLEREGEGEDTRYRIVEIRLQNNGKRRLSLV